MSDASPQGLTPSQESFLQGFVVKNLDTGEEVALSEADAYFAEVKLNTFHNTAYGAQALTVRLHRAEQVSEPKSGKAFTRYELTVQLHEEGKKWGISKRFRQFSALHASLRRAQFPGVQGLRLPPKRWVRRLDPATIDERRRMLEAYLNAVLSHVRDVRDAPPALVAFLHIPAKGVALPQVSAGTPGYTTLREAFPDYSPETR